MTPIPNSEEALAHARRDPELAEWMRATEQILRHYPIETS